MKEVSRLQFLTLALGLLSFIFFTVVFHSIVFILYGVISPILTLLALLLSLALVYAIGARFKFERPLFLPIVLTLVVAISIFLAGSTLDTTYDGNNYHKEAIGSLKNGWNPLYDEVGNIYSNTYPKASWIFASSIYQLTGDIETGKAINFIAAVITFCVVFWYVRIRLSVERSILIASLLALSPIMVTQLFNNYVDGLMGGLLITLTVLFNSLIDKKSKFPKRYIYAAIVATIVIICNLKFTGVVYSGIIAMTYFVYVLWQRNWLMVKQFLVVGALALFLAIGLVGSSTYVKNFVVHGHPLYPIMGEGAIPILADNVPVTYANKNRVYKFFESNLGETDNISAVWGFTEDKLDSRLKFPFTFSITELQLLSVGSPDLRQAGYGVWFGGILLLSGVAAIYMFIKKRPKLSSPELPLVFLPIIPIAITILAIEDAWWARYLPQLILFPVIVLTILYLGKSKVLAGVLSFALLFNTSLLLVLALSYQQGYAGEIEKNMNRLITCDSSKPQEIVVTKVYGDFTGSTYNMLDICNGLKIKHEPDINALDSGYVEIWNGIYTKDHTQR